MKYRLILVLFQRYLFSVKYKLLSTIPLSALGTPGLGDLVDPLIQEENMPAGLGIYWREKERSKK